MKKTLLILALLIATMTGAQAKGSTLPVYVWSGYPKDATAETLKKDFKEWKRHGVTGVCINAGMDIEKIKTASKVARKLGLEYHAWVPTMVQGGKQHSWYTVNRLGESAADKPAYVPYYTTLDPRNAEVKAYLVDKFKEIAAIPEVDFVQLDYIRYADVILARGLWDKYGLTMNGEYAAADYCYCADCVAAFKQQTGIDITRVTDPSKIEAWAQFRCDAVTALVNSIADAVHAAGKKLSADVFPGPKSYARWMVRQEWNKWHLDAVFPMNYNDFYMEPAAWVGKVTKEEAESVKATGMKLYSGIFICKDWQHKDKVVDPENSGLLPSEIAEAVRTSMEAGADGISIFTPGDMTAEHWAEFEKVVKEVSK